MILTLFTLIFFPNETIAELQKAPVILRLAAVYAHRVDYLLENDDSEKSFHERLNTELTELKQNTTGLNLLDFT